MNGILIVNKPPGITSYRVVQAVKDLLAIEKVGHGGTLDPLATGVLPIFLNRATRLSSFLMKDRKKYRATMKLGSSTDTQDRNGRVISESNHLPPDSRIIDALNSFIGATEQIPPMFSAVKVRGTPLYKLARRGISISRKPRTIVIHSLTVLGISPPLVTFEVTCSSGTYIRTLCADSGDKLGCGAHLVELSRLQCGTFHLDDSIPLDQLHSLSRNGTLNEHLFPLARAFEHLPGIVVDEQLITALKAKRTLSVSQLRNRSTTPFNRGDIIRLSASGKPGMGLVQARIASHQVSSSPDTSQALKLVCFINPLDNTLH